VEDAGARPLLKKELPPLSSKRFQIVLIFKSFAGKREQLTFLMNPTNSPPLRIAIIGAGWAGLAAAIETVQRGHQVTVFEAAHHLGGRARTVAATLADGRSVLLDNGQHILIGAYTECLRLLRTVGVEPERALQRLPLALRFADGGGLQLPHWLPAPLDAAWGIARARGWRWRERAALLRTAAGWHRGGFACDARASVQDLCAGLPPRVMAEFIEPLCVAALNTPVHQASGAVFLRVLRDGLLGPRGSSNLLLPRVDLGALFPQAAARWLAARGAAVHTGQRVPALHWQAPHWHLAGQAFNHVVCATAAPNAAQIMAQTAQEAPDSIAHQLLCWSARAAALQHRPITTVYAQATPPATSRPLLAAPMLALRSSADAPAQFVFERDAIAPTGNPTGLLAFVVSDSHGERAALQAAVVTQAARQLGLAVQPLQTITEKRATFACTAGLQRPATAIAPGLSACGDAIDGPYPATLEGAVRSATEAIATLHARAATPPEPR